MLCVIFFVCRLSDSAALYWSMSRRSLCTSSSLLPFSTRPLLGISILSSTQLYAVWCLCGEQLTFVLQLRVSCDWADPVSLVRDHRVKQGLASLGITVHTFNGDLLYEPWEVYDDNGHAFTTFEAFWRKCLNMPFEPEAPLLSPRRLDGGDSDGKKYFYAHFSFSHVNRNLCLSLILLVPRQVL